MSLHIKLKEATRSLHEDTEQQLFPNQAWEDLLLDDYQHFLQIQYLFHSSIEQAIASAISSSLKNKVHWSQREKSPKIQADLLEINARVPEPSSLGINLLSDSEVIGMMYVAEGSMLGNRMIYKTLQNNQHIAPYSSFLFLNGYGSQTSRLWKEFLQVLSQNVEEKDEITVIEAAKRAFGIFAESVSFIYREIST